MGSRSKLERHIGDLAEVFGWLRHSGHGSGLMRDGRPDGFPPEALLRAGRLVFLFMGETQTPRQRDWLEALNDVVAVEAHVCPVNELSMVTQLLRRSTQ